MGKDCPSSPKEIDSSKCRLPSALLCVMYRSPYGGGEYFFLRSRQQQRLVERVVRTGEGGRNRSDCCSSPLAGGSGQKPHKHWNWRRGRRWAYNYEQRFKRGENRHMIVLSLLPPSPSSLDRQRRGFESSLCKHTRSPLPVRPLSHIRHAIHA